MSQLGEALGERYRVEDPIGQGGMATVYRAEDLRHSRPVALKVLRAELTFGSGSERFDREIRLTARLQHPNILPVFDSGQAAGLLWYTMPLVEGESLRQRLDRDRRIPLDEAIRLTCEVAEALDYAHAQSIVHRDIKPENILLSRGHALVADFGIARAFTPTRTERHLTIAGLSVGTPAYMSPEQASGEETLDGRSDLFALACVFYEMLAGAPPHEGTTPQALLIRRITERAARLSTKVSVPEQVDQAVERALAIAPGDRFGTATAFAAALTGAADGPAGKPSLVVVPFEDLSAGHAEEYFTDGLTEEIITSLSQIRCLRVISRASAMRLKGTPKTAPEIARELGVRYLLTGTVRRGGNHLRVGAQLVDAPNDEQLWAERYDGTCGEVFEIQDRIAAAITGQLRLTLTAEESRRMLARPIQSFRAYEFYLRARQEASRFTPLGVERAMQLLEQGLAVVGPNELIYGAMGFACITSMEAGIGDPEVLLPRIQELAAKIVELNPYSAHAWVLRGAVHYRRGDIQEAVDPLKRALAADPTNIDALLLLTNSYLLYGATAEAKPLAKRLIEADPLTALNHSMLAWIETLEGGMGAGLESLRRAGAMDPSNPLVRLFLGTQLLCAEQAEEAAHELRQLAEDRSHPGISAVAAFLGAAHRGEASAAHTILASDLQPAIGRIEYLSRIVAIGWVILREFDEAVRWVRRAVQHGFLNYPMMSAENQVFSALRGHPAYEELLREVKVKYDAFRP
ncbi:MAG: protein kinase [Gemmatimonadales bacterium]|nr:protein kinase [Gemmatimonadales bacterium]